MTQAETNFSWGRGVLAVTLTRTIGRNVLGWTLILLGTLFGWLPFVQGFLLVFLGLAIADWPGKRKTFRWLRTFRWFRKFDRWAHQKLGFHLPEHRTHRQATRNGSAGQ
jgi:hypothetical protein